MSAAAEQGDNRGALVPIAELHQDPANVRQHGDRNVKAIMGSLARFGQQKPVVVGRADKVIIAGNGTVEAATRLGWKDVRVTWSDLKGSDRTAYAIADNRTAELAEWDDAALAEQLSALAIEDDDLLAATGFDESELEQLVDEMAGGAEVVEDEVPEPPADSVTKPGDLWVLGEHRVLCGDCRGAAWGDDAACIWTDPPYGVDHVGGSKDPRDKKNHRSGGVVHNDSLPEPELVALIVAGVSGVPVTDSACMYMAAPAGNRLAWLMAAFDASGFEFRHSLVWVKNQIVFGRADYHYQHELVLYGWQRGKTHKWYGDRKQSSVHDHRIGDRGIAHPTSKPVGLVASTLANSTKAGSWVADPFLGSGTTLIAAEQLGRRCYGIEISPAYCDVIVERWQNLTGGKATRTNAA